MNGSYRRLAAIRDYWMPRDIDARAEVRVTDLDEILRKIEPAQEPVAWLDQDINASYTAAEMDGDSTEGLVPLYTAPPQRPPLTDEEIDHLSRPLNEAFADRLVGRLCIAVLLAFGSAIWFWYGWTI